MEDGGFLEDPRSAHRVAAGIVLHRNAQACFHGSMIGEEGVEKISLNRPQTKTMRNKLHILVCIAALCVLPLLAGDGETKSLSVEQRLRETDLSLALRQYERVKMESFETRLKLDLLGTDDDITETVRIKRAELLERRSNMLEQRAADLRNTALKLGDAVAVAKAK